MINFEYKLNYSEDKELNNEKSTTYHYDILNRDAVVGQIIALYNKNTNTVTLTVRVKWFDSYVASGTAKQLMQDIIEKVIHHSSKARVVFNQYDMHTVALLEMNNISSKIAFK